MKDDLFLRGHKVPMTKEVVRLAALERLNLPTAKRLIDVGAGTGSVSLEAALRYPDLQITAIERNPVALALIADNCRHFGCPNIAVVDADAPLPLDVRADAIFIGGSGGNLADIIDWSLGLLNDGGSLVMNFILLENYQQAFSQLQNRAVTELESSLIQVSRLTALGSGHYFKPNNPTYLISCRKEQTHG
ncbi:decarboxylating cobalt-precorrin-6B (C(15))-methyltransferase [Hafnia paralvei]|uniref:decarboxylating cobalt-precorrin-6B (C(15))-methyltransferase n=1 Tax=Hafnia paralvei TaxID=546367 RepID=UPI003CF313A9